MSLSAAWMTPAAPDSPMTRSQTGFASAMRSSGMTGSLAAGSGSAGLTRSRCVLRTSLTFVGAGAGPRLPTAAP